MWKTQTLTGWGRTTASAVPAARPERIADIQAALSAAATDDAPVLAHGNGRSYGDQVIAPSGRAVLMRRLNRILSFDDETGTLVAEPGITFDDLLDIFLPRGWLFPVSPGTSFATLGGALANDVHGKNHDVVGSFGDHVEWIELVLADGSVRRVSPQEDAALFQATIGGMGLTGIVTALAFRLMRVPSNAVVRQRQRINGLDGFLKAFADVHRRGATYSVGWIDGMARGKNLGRGILEIAEPAEEDIPAEPRKARKVPFDLPSLALNPLSIRAFNAIYRRQAPEAGSVDTLPYRRFLYPLDAIEHWNRIYGKRGFYQFQAVLPGKDGAVALEKLLTEIAKSRRASFLSVLKTLGGTGRGHLSFPMRGYTLALDFPRSKGAAALIGRLERLTLDYGGRVYLAKDALLSPEGFRTMYPEWQRFRAVLERVDPQQRFTSAMAHRLKIREAE